VIIGTICLVLGVAAMISWPWLLWRAFTVVDEWPLVLALVDMGIAVIGLAIGGASYVCVVVGPPQCYGGVPWF